MARVLKNKKIGNTRLVTNYGIGCIEISVMKI